MAIPGEKVIHGEVVIRLRASLIMLPHSAIGGLAPRPRKLRAASSIIMVPISSTAVTRMGPRILGSICRSRSPAVPLPESRAARIQGASLRARVWLRASRAYLGQDTAASARMALCSPPPRAPATARANTSPGKARNISDTRMSTASAHPPKKPPQRPTAVPSTVTAATSSSVEKMLVRLPTMTRDSISRP